MSMKEGHLFIYSAEMENCFARPTQRETAGTSGMARTAFWNVWRTVPEAFLSIPIMKKKS